MWKCNNIMRIKKSGHVEENGFRNSSRKRSESYFKLFFYT